MFDGSVQSYWSATHPQIYRTLDDIGKQGLIFHEKIQLWLLKLDGQIVSENKIITVLEEYVREIEKHIEELESKSTQIDDFAHTERETYLWQRILDNGLSYYQTEAAWARETIAGITAIQSIAGE